MLSDAEFSHKLDVALAPISKIFQHPIPFHNRLNALGGSLSENKRILLFNSSQHRLSASYNSNNNTSRSNEITPGETQHNNNNNNNTEALLTQIAKAECEARIEGLQEWLTQAKEGKYMGEKCLSVLYNLSNCLTSMREVTGAVQEQSNHLSNNASALMVRKTKLEMVQEELQRMIQHFSRIESLTRESEQATLSAISARYPNMLQEMEEEMQFLSRNPQFLSSKTYATKLALAQQKAFQCLRDAIISSFISAQNNTVDSSEYKNAFYQGLEEEKEKEVASNVVVTTSETNNNNNNSSIKRKSLPFPDNEENFEAKKAISEALQNINNIFLTKLDEKASLRRMMEARGGSENQTEDDMNENEIFEAYREVRVVIIGPLLQNWLESWCSVNIGAKQMTQLVSNLCILMKIVLMQEKEIFDYIWLREDFSARIFPQLISGISNEVYQVFRSRLLQVDELEELAETIEEIQRTNSKQDIIAELGDLFTKMIQDAQERLIFRTSVFLRQAIVRCSPTKEIIQKYISYNNNNNNTTTTTTMFDDNLPYIPALTNCVALLRLLYPCLEFSAFSVFAEEAIHCTLIQVQELAKVMGQQKVEFNILKSLLCQLQHLLHLREELARIDENITVVEKSIDLTKIAQRRLEIVQSSRESKKDVESEIKNCCDNLVRSFIAEVSSPLIGIARKNNNTSEIQLAVIKVEEKWKSIENLLQIFISNPLTREILLRPVKLRLDELLHETNTIQQEKKEKENQREITEKVKELSTPIIPSESKPANDISNEKEEEKREKKEEIQQEQLGIPETQLEERNSDLI